MLGLRPVHTRVCPMQAIAVEQGASQVNDDLQDNLKNIYKEIKTAKQGKYLSLLRDQDELINKASDYFDAVPQATEAEKVSRTLLDLELNARGE
jgi:hypothetical protein